MKKQKTVAIIGAGMAGITLARQIHEQARVTVFEKSRGYGGRMAVRRQDVWQFDHGAQFFTARSSEFQLLTASLVDAGIIAAWEPRIVSLQPAAKPYKRLWYEPHYVAVPGMSGVVKHLATELDVRLQTRVAAIHRFRQGWLLQDETGQELGQYDLVVAALPAPQCIELMPAEFSGQQQLAAVEYSPCFALMLGFEQSLNLSFGAAIVKDSPIGWIAVGNARPGRSDSSSLLLHSDNHWAENNLELPLPAVQQSLLNALADLRGIDLPAPAHIDLHRWRYARVEGESFPGVLLDAKQGLAACGDWSHGKRVEDAFLSGLILGQTLSDLLRG